MGAKPDAVPQLSGVVIAEARGQVTYTLVSTLPEASLWLETLAGSQLT
jgi:hypothetical protein